LAYVLHIPFAVRSQRWVAAHPEAWNDKPRQRRAARREIRRARHPDRNRRSVARLGLRKPGGPDS
jgi:CDP-diacylglycerol--serine O-phosphatidyltransferase